MIMVIIEYIISTYGFISRELVLLITPAIFIKSEA